MLTLGGVSNLGAMGGRASRGIKMRTLRMSIEDIMMDWAKAVLRCMMNNQRPYGLPVMYPVEDLLDYLSREFRAPMDYLMECTTIHQEWPHRSGLCRTW